MRVNSKPTISSNTVAHPWLFCHQAQNQPSPWFAYGGPFTENRGVGGPYAVNVTVEAKPVWTRGTVVRVSDVEVALIDTAYAEVGGGFKLSVPWAAG